MASSDEKSPLMEMSESSSYAAPAAARRLSEPAFRATLSWESVTAVARSSRSLSDRVGGVKSEDKVILDNVRGIARATELIALMGASGAGKTTLLDFLANQTSSLKVTGTVRLNGRKITKSELGNVAAYVHQEDLFIGTLKVSEHLRFQAALRMKQGDTTQVDDIMREMGLEKCKDTVIGIPGKMKGISGGEKKRLAFASEILGNPSILLADEPTSGLDSFMAESVVHVLQRLASSGRTVLCTIHQPSSDTFALFDRLILLSQGRVAYYGSSVDAMPFFSKLGFQCPTNYNPADFYIRELAIVPGKEGKCREKAERICNAFEESEHAGALNRSLADETNRAADSELIPFSKSKGYNAHWCTQFGWVCLRAWLSNIRDKTAVRVKIGQSIVIALLMGLMYYKTGYDQQRVQNIPAALFFAVIQLSISTMIAVLQTFPVEMPVFLREHRSRLYRPLVFYLAKSIADTPFVVIQVLVFSAVSYFMIGLHDGADRFFLFFSLCVIIAMVSLSLGYLVSASVPSVSVALAIGPVSFIPFLLFGGFFIRSGTVPVYLEWIQYISWFYYGFEALMINEWRGTNLTCSSIQNCFSNGTQVLDHLGLVEVSVLSCRK
ncbi:protein white-like isoform X3 [Oscarella lobularis]|uniref:protein white-like isoform X3 n=1 Tax=Oscarella lobularis TaxID=121494 RepID=UPI003313D9C7